MPDAMSLRAASPFKKSFFQHLKSSKKLWGLLLFLQALGFPLIAVAGGIGIYASEKYPLTTDNHYIDYDTLAAGLVFVGICALVISAACGLVIIIQNFSYLFRRDEADTCLSLPITRKDQFWSRALAGLTQYMLPFFAAIIISVLIIIISVLITASLPNVTLSKIMDEYFLNDLVNNQNLIFLGVLFIAGLMLACVLFYSLCLLICTCCGRLFEAAAYPIFLNMIIPVTVIICGSLAIDGVFGIDDNSLYSNFFFCSTSPIGAIVYLFAYFDGLASMGYWAWFVSVLLVIALMLFVSYKVYIGRKAEDVGSPIVVRMLLYIVECIMILCIIELQSLDSHIFINQTTFISIFIALICYVVIELVSNGKQKKYLSSILRFVGALLGSFLFLGAADVTGFFGIESYVPPVNSVFSVEIDTYLPEMMYSNGVPIKLDDKDNVKAATQIHKSILDTWKKCNGNLELAPVLPTQISGIYFNIRYQYGPDMYLQRSYDCIPVDIETLYGIIHSDEYLDAYIETLRSEEADSLQVNLSVAGANSISAILNISDIDGFLAAYRADLDAMTVQQFISVDYKTKLNCDLSYSAYNDNGRFYEKHVAYFTIPSYFKNTMEFLDVENISFTQYSYEYTE